MFKFFKTKLKIFIIITIVSISTIGTMVTPITVAATPEQDLELLQQKLQEIANQKKTINDQINQESGIQDEMTRELTKLKNEISLLDNQISETELNIQQIQLQIQILEQEIAATENKIIEAKKEIETLQLEADNRFVDMYIEQKTFSQLNMVFSNNITNIVKLESYQKSLQEETDKLLSDLNLKKEELNKQKDKMEADKIQVSRDEVTVQEKKLALEKNKSTIDSQRQIYYRKRNESMQKIADQEKLKDLLEEQEKVALAEQSRLIEQISDSITEITSGTYISAGKGIGYQGCTGLCTGDHLHFAVQQNGSYVNPCNVLAANSACGGSGSLAFPMKGSYVLTSGYGMRWGSFHYGIDVANYSDGAPIYASHSGYITYGNDGICKNYHGSLPCNGSGANYAIICENKNCKVGLKTMYWHLR
ncbi:MAG: hypothetical protein WCJ58_03400 [bacterium]